MPGPVTIAVCRIEIDLEKKDLPTIRCWRDRERTVNPELQKGLVCETEFETFERDGKSVQQWEVVCRPPMKLYRKLRHALSPNLVEELRERMRSQTSQSKSAPPKKP